MARALAVSLAVHAPLLAGCGEGVPPAAAQSRKPAPYYEARELDRRPQFASHVEPSFPALALAPSGEVVVALYVNERGGVDRVVVESDDPSGAFAASAQKAFAEARFLPAMKAGRPVKALMRIQVLFGSPHPANAGRTR